MRAEPFTRPTIIAAVEALESHVQAKFDQMILRLGLEEDIPQGAGVSVGKKCAMLGREVLRRPAQVVQTVDGNVTLAEAVVREAVKVLFEGAHLPHHEHLLRGLARDGYVVVWPEHRGGVPTLRAALPGEVDLPAADDEVHGLLTGFGFVTPLGHLDQAIEAHTRGDWAAANGQARTFMESLFDDISRHVRPEEAARRPTAENRRALLAELGFLSDPRKEWTSDGKNYLNGLFKMLHTEGAHPGLSDEDHSTFRLHVVLVTARVFLRRLRYQQ